MKKRLLTGDRPTGALHLGHYVGSLANRITAQEEYECFFIIADIHTLTTRPQKKHISDLKENIHKMVLEYLSVGINPDKSTIFVQSLIPETFELNTILEMLVSVPRLERIPSLKEMTIAADLKTQPFGLLGYPVMMAADILLPRAELVPVGADNRANLELARELARRFNRMYDAIFPIPDFQIEGTLIGTDGQAKMSKSLDNAIFLTDDAPAVEHKVMSMFTDPNRLSADTPGRVEGNPVFLYHDAFNSDHDEIAELKERYRGGKVGDVDVKKKLVRVLNDFLDPIRERRNQLEGDPDLVNDVLAHGIHRMRLEAQETILMVREAMDLPSYAYAKALQGVEPVRGLALV
ncbi:MAG: tryptophan--tRNA ligase [Anaerolineales bacterium]|nr:tryptophan--tRNA ligase [Chloroflexota bacterium]MBL6983725.1 tryptophan--tRNA ligase [Anaerolineales bacterium]